MLSLTTGVLNAIQMKARVERSMMTKTTCWTSALYQADDGRIAYPEGLSSSLTNLLPFDAGSDGWERLDMAWGAGRNEQRRGCCPSLSLECLNWINHDGGDIVGLDVRVVDLVKLLYGMCVGGSVDARWRDEREEEKKVASQRSYEGMYENNDAVTASSTAQLAQAAS
jgi:hypothetical protein